VSDLVLVGSAFVAKYPAGGGMFWLPLQYLLGLRALGVNAHWLELLWPDPDVERAREFRDGFLRQAHALGIADHVTVVLFSDTARDAPPGREERAGALADHLWARARDAVLLNFAESVPRALRDRFGRTALFDIDPGQFQLWARGVDLGVGSHDLYLTIGANLGAPDCPVPLGDVPWQHVWPAVHLPAWPVVAGRDAAAPYTTVTQWWGGGWTVLGDEVIEGHKRASFLRVLDLPARVPVALELAANIHPEEMDDRRALADAGWRLADPAVVAGTAETFRAYVQASRGEFSCAKPAYVRTRPGWISDRTVCYLASGRPCVVEDTGLASHLPASPGLRFFRTVDEAAEQLRAVERDYAAAARGARAIAEEVFAASVALRPLVKIIGLR
jgi:hypothetical protein